MVGCIIEALLINSLGKVMSGPIVTAVTENEGNPHKHGWFQLIGDKHKKLRMGFFENEMAIYNADERSFNFMKRAIEQRIRAKQSRLMSLSGIGFSALMKHEGIDK